MVRERQADRNRPQNPVLFGRARLLNGPGPTPHKAAPMTPPVNNSDDAGRPGFDVPLAARMGAVKPSATVAMTRIANELRRAGRDIIGLSVGEPDFDTPEHVRDAAKAAARERGMAGKHVITLQRSSVEPFLQFSSRRDLREKAFRAWIARGDGGADHAGQDHEYPGAAGGACD